MAVKLKQFITAFSVQGQAIESMFQKLYALRSINTSTNAQLDGIGEIAGESRLGRDDEKYRIAIVFRLFLNVSSGEPETLLAATKFLTKGTVATIKEIYPATVQLFTDGTAIDFTTTSFLQSLAPAGVKLYLTQIAGRDGFIFGEDGQSDPITKGKSFSEAINSTDLYLDGGVPVGGQFVEQLV